MKSVIFGLILICLSERFFEIITFSKSSVGNSIPIYKKLFILDFKSFNLKFTLPIDEIEFITTKLLSCLD